MASNADAVLAAGWCAMASRNTGTARTDWAWHLGVVDWFYLMFINADVKPSQSAGTGDWAGCAACSGGVVRDGIAQYWDSTDGWGLAFGCGWGGWLVLLDGYSK